MGRKFFLAIFGALLLALPLCAQDTGWLNPSQNFGDFRYPERAYYDDTLYAVASPGQIHIYYGYQFNIPASAEILGIEVRLDVWRQPSGVPFVAYLDVQLSWDGGQNWTSLRTAGPIEASEQSYILGGPNDLWERRWNPGEFQPGTFMVRLAARAPRWPEIRLDWVAVRVYYSGELSLEISPKTIDFGTLSLADYDRGYRELLAAQTVRLAAPSTWTLYIAAVQSTWTYSGDLPNPQKPCEHLLWRVEYADGSVSTAENTFIALATAEKIVAKGTAGLAKLSISFRLIVDYDTTWPGIYSLDFRYTLVSP